MKIISHRGLWHTDQEKNSYLSFERSFKHGFGTETDVRDDRGNLVISHDPPVGGEMSLEDFFKIEAIRRTSFPLALNVKADGLASRLKTLISRHMDLDIFFFDMSIPDMRCYFDAGLPVFSRMSEVERSPVWLDRASGIWLDAFERQWYTVSTIREFIEGRKRVCVVSPELHKRDYISCWCTLRSFTSKDNLILCTDLPEQARRFMNEGVL